MSVRPVFRLPEKVLRTRAADVVHIDDDALGLARDLVDTMRVSPGCVGLAAPQIGVGLRAFSMDVSGHRKTKTCHGLVVLFNPVIMSADEAVVGREGCMSVPDLTGDVARATKLVVTGISTEGKELTIETNAFEARAIEHEVDHLDGLLFLDRVTSHGGIFPRRVYK